MHYLYIIYSESSDKFYIGETYDIGGRILKHNCHEYGGAFTKITNDWKAVLIHECLNEAEAVYLERFIKRMKSKKFILKVIAQPGILNDIISKKNNPCVPGSPEASGLEVPLKP